MMLISTRRRLAVVALIVLLALLVDFSTALAHRCGPETIELQVGQSCPWRITADRLESLSNYAPALEGDQSVASVEPLIPFQAHHGNFMVTGRKPGTNTLSVAWGYPPTGAFGFCEVTIVVREADPENKPLDAPAGGGTLATEGPQMITGDDLKSFLESHLPAEAEKLLVFTQCFGGSIASSEGFRDMPNTAIASASSANQTAKYGGYDDDAARGLRPEEGRTALDMHRDAILGRSSTLPAPDEKSRDKNYLFKEEEWPITAGGLGLESFSLAPVTPAGPIKSRHIIFYAGQPEKKQIWLETQDGHTVRGTENAQSLEVGDFSVRDQVVKNFMGQPNTTVRTVGGKPASEKSTEGTEGWDYAGTYPGLERAVREAGEAIRNASDPSAEQFILYVGDHGGQGFTLVAEPTTFEAGTSLSLTVDLSTLQGAETWLEYSEYEIENQPTLQLDVAPETSGESPQSQRRIIGMVATVDTPPNLQITVTPEDGRPRVLTEPDLLVIDSNGDGNIEPEDGDRFRFAFPFPESLLVGRTASRAFAVNLLNQSSENQVLSTLQLNSGKISKNTATVTPAYFRYVEILAPNRVRFEVRGAPGETYQLAASNEFGEWNVIGEVYFDTEIMTFEKDVQTATGANYFRLVWNPPPPL